MLFENNCLSLILTTTLSLFRKKRFEINFYVQQNASKFAIFIEKENPHYFFLFFILSNFEFYLMNALVYVDSEQWYKNSADFLQSDSSILLDKVFILST